MIGPDPRARAINAIMDSLQGSAVPLPLGIDLRPIAERIYSRAGRDVMEAVQAEMREADRG